LEDLQLLDEGFEVLPEVELFYYSAFAGGGALAEKNLALGGIEQRLIVCNYVFRVEQHFSLHYYLI
jgi:hypothetical protein